MTFRYKRMIQNSNTLVDVDLSCGPERIALVAMHCKPSDPVKAFVPLKKKILEEKVNPVATAARQAGIKVIEPSDPKEKFTHLVYVGFNTDICMMRSKGNPIDMTREGFACILLEDCTASYDRPDIPNYQKAMIRLFQVAGCGTMTSKEFLEAVK